MTNHLAVEVARLRRELAQVKKGQRLAHGASVEDSAIEVRDDTGSLRAIVGQQGDGTTAALIVNGPPPPQPSDPIVASVIGGVTASWDGLFADGAVMPLDWSRIEVHASTAAVFTPDSVTLQSTIETAQGATVVIPCETDVYVCLVARSTSGTASTPSGIAGPVGPAPVVATDILDGIVTTVKLADDAVTAAKVAAAAIDSTALADGAVLSAKLAAAAVSVGKIANNAVTGPAIAADAVTAGKIAADAVTAREIAAGSVTASEVAAGAITTDKITVSGGSNMLADPGFEGPYTAALVTGDAYWAVDTTKGNGSSKSLRVTATAATATNRDLTLFDMPIQPGDQLYLATDYQASTDFAGTPRIYARWENSTGGFLSTSAAQASPPVLGATWQRISATVTAPANTARVKLNVASTGGTAGQVWFDNATVRPVAGGTQIADGAITTQKIVAGAVQTLQLDAEAVNASKIAAGAVTTAKLDALAVTADKIAANTITAGKLAAGSVDATALKADAITGKTITGGTITGAVVTGGIIQTSTTGQRLLLNPAAVDPDNPSGTVPAVELHSGLVAQLSPGSIAAKVDSSSAAYPYISLRSPAVAEVGPGGGEPDLPIDSEIKLLSTQPGVRGGSFEINANSNPYASDLGSSNVYGYVAEDSSGTSALELTCFDGNSAPGGSGLLGPGTTLSMSGSQVQIRAANASTDRSVYVTTAGLAVDGAISAGNFAFGTASITPSAAHTPTSTTVFYNVIGTAFRGFASLNTTVPGVRSPLGPTFAGVTGVSVSGATATSMLVWVNRENTTATNVNWQVWSA
ncbi:hypothetical protein [Streptomyces sp. NPDC059783]|uniref:hypothetical protein n=1 Tax=Streptomyces sp. NPDC059783 TaxID=3346944 RepID=UPI003649B847